MTPRTPRPRVVRAFALVAGVTLLLGCTATTERSTPTPTPTGAVVPEIVSPDAGSRVRVNQVGYLPRGPKVATLVTAASDPIPWQLIAPDGTVLASGRTAPHGADTSSGLTVQTIDFGSYPASGTGLTIVADGETSYPFDIDASAYGSLPADALTFFYTQRSGAVISDDVAPGYGRAAGHLGVAPNQGDTAVPCQDLDDDSQLLYDEPWTCEGVTDVSGGWYDAGDHGKYVVNGGIAVAQLMQAYERTTTAPSGTGDSHPDVLGDVRWELEWMLKMQVRPGRPMAGMAFHKVADVDWTGIPLAPADDPQRRVLYRPSTAATLNLAAVAAQGARVFAGADDDFAARLLAASRIAYAAARSNPEVYAPPADAALDPNAGSGPYDDADVSDEFYWAAAELFLTTGEPAFRDDVLASAVHTADVFPAGGFNWAEVGALGRLDLAAVANDLPDGAAVRRSVLEAADRYLAAVANDLPDGAAVRRSVLEAADRYLAAQATQPFGHAYAPDRGVYAWGSNGAILNNLQVLGTAYDLSGAARFRDGVLRGLDYLFGRNALNRSYVTGYGEVFSQNQHSRMYAHQIDPTSPHPPSGTIAGGPNSGAAATGDPLAADLAGCAAQLCYVDDIGSWSTNEITINWNAPLYWVAAFVVGQADALR
ncbi:glycoside hydrolase family 9 protein [Pengzhenrongella phosphoraccumulans]|uniref:glycoside hydrolase family 9 protein n=1 Tax=Pengzhenrongella phosphoraccumulans TaxID=3114394 RepID=UPI00388E4250